VPVTSRSTAAPQVAPQRSATIGGQDVLETTVVVYDQAFAGIKSDTTHGARRESRDHDSLISVHLGDMSR